MAQTRTKSKPKASARANSSTSTARTTQSKKRSATARTANQDGSMLSEYFLHALKDIYWAEKALTKALPKLTKEATAPALKKAFESHLAVTKKQVTRLEQIFQKLGKKAQAKKCDAMKGLIEESETAVSETKDDSSTRDAALIITAQKVEHYEIATYGGLVQLAKTMKKNDIAKLLETTLEEEKKADVQLTKIAEQGGVNAEASKEEPQKKTAKESIMALFS